MVAFVCRAVLADLGPNEDAVGGQRAHKRRGRLDRGDGRCRCVHVGTDPLPLIRLGTPLPLAPVAVISDELRKQSLLQASGERASFAQEQTSHAQRENVAQKIR